MTKKTLRSFAAAALAVATLSSATTLAVAPAFADPVGEVPADGSATAVIANSAGEKLVGLGTSTWGSFGTDRAITAWTEAYVGGQWLRSQTVTTSSTGYFTIPLTYGSNSAGTHKFRVRGQLPDGTIATSNEFTLKRRALPTAYSAGEKLVGLSTSTWGRLDTNKATTAWTEVNVGGQWHRSQTVTTSSNGSYTIPLTYGTHAPGTYSFRVRGTYPDGTVATSKTFTLKRMAQPTANSAGTKPVGQGTSTWGTFDVNQSIPAWTEVNIGGQWHKSQQVTTDRNGNHVIPLTYGASTPGTYTFRVRGQDRDGTLHTSNTFTLKRTATTKYDWMRAAGIPESDWHYVDYIVMRESTWNPRAVNRSSGACGLVQAYPCSKLGPQWYDPVVALKWQYNYVKSRYGSYAGAYSFWLRNHWY